MTKNGTSDNICHMETDYLQLIPLDLRMQSIEREIVHNALQAARWNATAAAHALGITFRAMRHKQAKLGLRYRETGAHPANISRAPVPNWAQLRYQAFIAHGNRCQCCGATPMTGAQLHVDHIKPIALFPALSADVDNLQVLCEQCNKAKGATDSTDWR